MAEHEQQRKLTQEEYLARKYGDFQQSGLDRVEAVVVDRHGNEVKIWIREFTEADLQLREEVMIDQSGVMRNAKQQAKNNRRNRGGPPQIKVKPSNRRRFDIVEGIADWNLTRIKFGKDNSIVFELDDEGKPKLDDEGYPIPVLEAVECTPKEKMKVKGYLSEQMIREVRKINDLPMEEDLDDEDDEPEDDTPQGVYDTDFDTSVYDDVVEEEEGSEDNVTPLQNQKSSQSKKEGSGDTSKSRRSSGSSS